jgi:beta-glucanase (GH16 family)
VPEAATDAGSGDAGAADAGSSDAGAAGAGSSDAGAAGADRPPQLSGSYTLAWADEFEGAALDAAKWTGYPGPHRDGYDTADAVTVSDGKLAIRTYTEGGMHYSALLSSQGLFEAVYGYYEARIRFFDSPGEWCAFWLQSPTNGQPVGNPGIAGAEIDVVEHRLIDDLNEDVSNLASINIHYDGYGADHKTVNAAASPRGAAPPLQGYWHTYGVLWTDASYTFYIDDIPVFAAAAGVSKRTESVWLSCEVQDGTWAGRIPAGGYGPRDRTTSRMEVDWVRVWQSH